MNHRWDDVQGPQGERGEVGPRGEPGYPTRPFARIGPFKLDTNISLTGLIGATMAFTALVGGWYTFSNRIGNTETAIMELKQQHDVDIIQRDRLNDTLNRLDNTLGVIEQALEDNHIQIRLKQ